jgi:putative phosphotransacetylase
VLCFGIGKGSWAAINNKDGGINKLTEAKISEACIPVGVSGRHVHLSREHLEALFGPGYELTKMKELGQPGQFSSEETVDIITTKGAFTRVRILGPVRKETQIELALSDSVKLGITPPIRDSGNIANSPGVVLVGPNGTITLDQGAIIAWRHIHMTPEDAKRFGVKDKEMVQVECLGERAMTMGQVLVRVNEQYALEMHVDTDEGNAACLKTGNKVRLA